MFQQPKYLNYAFNSFFVIIYTRISFKLGPSFDRSQFRFANQSFSFQYFLYVFVCVQPVCDWLRIMSNGSDTSSFFSIRILSRTAGVNPSCFKNPSTWDRCVLYTVNSGLTCRVPFAYSWIWLFFKSLSASSNSDRDLAVRVTRTNPLPIVIRSIPSRWPVYRNTFVLGLIIFCMASYFYS